MFTGIIETVGTIKQVVGGDPMRIAVDLNRIAEGVALGESIAVNGVCLTVCQLAQTVATFDVSSETVRLTSLKQLRAGGSVNLERAMSAQGRFGGHIVQGHVDGLATIAAITRQADFATFRFAAPKHLLDQMVLKGSVAVDGVSVTVAKLDESGFEVAVIPTTLKETTWHTASIGQTVNIETDILIKVVKKQLEQVLPSQDGLTVEKLRGLGF